MYEGPNVWTDEMTSSTEEDKEGSEVRLAWKLRNARV